MIIVNGWLMYEDFVGYLYEKIYLPRTCYKDMNWNCSHEPVKFWLRYPQALTLQINMILLYFQWSNIDTLIASLDMFYCTWTFLPFQLNEMLAQKGKTGNKETTPESSRETTADEQSGATKSKQKCENCSCGQKCLSEEVENLQLDRRKIDPALIDFWMGCQWRGNPEVTSLDILINTL